MRCVLILPIVALLATTLVTQAQDDWPRIRPTRVEVQGDRGSARATVVAVNVAVDEIVDRIAEKTGRRVEGFGPTAIRSWSPSSWSTDRSCRCSKSSWARSASRSSCSRASSASSTAKPRRATSTSSNCVRSPTTCARPARSRTTRSPRARLDQGELEEKRGRLEAAFDHYQSMIEGFPFSDLVPDAHLLSGAVLEKLGRFDEAHTEYMEVTQLAASDPRRNRARLALARCQLELGNPSLTVLMVRRLEEEEPTTDLAIQSERLALMATALERAALPMEALEVLDQLERLGGPITHAVEAMEVRARALEALDLLEAASRAWLVVARERGGSEAHPAYLRAAELTETVGDSLSLLFLAKEASKADPPLDLSRYERSARLELGLAVELPDSVPPEERWEIIADWLDEELFERADPELAALYDRRLALDPDLAREVVERHTERVYLTAGLESALSVLREARRDLDDPAIRAAFDLRAGKLLEGERAYVRAAAAYQGDY